MKNSYECATPHHTRVHAWIPTALSRIAGRDSTGLPLRVRFDADRPRKHASGGVRWLSAIWYGPGVPGNEPWPGVIYVECREGGTVSVRDGGPRPRADRGLPPADVDAATRRMAHTLAEALDAALGEGGLRVDPAIARPDAERAYDRRVRARREAEAEARADLDGLLSMFGGDQ